MGPCWLVGSLQNVSVIMLTGCFLQNVSTMTLIGWNIAECFKNHDADWLEYCRMFQQPWRSLVGILQNVSTTMTVIGWNIAGCFKHNCIWLEFCRIFQPWCWLVGILQNISTMMLIGLNSVEWFNHDADWLDSAEWFNYNSDWLEFCRMIQPWSWLVGIL